MSNVIVFEKSNPSIGYVARTVTAGDELRMVYRYLSYVKNKSNNLKRKRIAIFVEPHIETGYPDLVIVEYYLPPSDIWCNARMCLNNTDLKILMHVVSSRTSYLSISSICELLGFTDDTVYRSLKKLNKCKLVYLSKSQKMTTSSLVTLINPFLIIRSSLSSLSSTHFIFPSFKVVIRGI